MLDTLARNWWLVVFRGVIAIIFGIMAFVWPGITVGALVLLFGVYALIDGISALIAGLTGRTGNRRGWVLFLEGLAGIAAAVVTFLYTGITAVILLYVIAAWAMVTGVMEIAAAISLRRQLDGEWALGFSGLLSIVFGAVLFLNPGPGALALIWVIGAYAVVFGVLLIYLGISLRDTDQPLAVHGA